MEQRVQIARHLRPRLRIEIPKINDALGRRLRAGFEQLLPILERFRAQRKAVVAIELRIGLPGLTTRQRAPISRSREINASPSPDSSAKTSHDFSSGVSLDCFDRSRSVLLQTSARADRSGLRRQSGRSDPATTSSRKAGLPQHRFPLRPLQQRLFGTQIAIGETPPAAR